MFCFLSIISFACSSIIIGVEAKFVIYFEDVTFNEVDYSYLGGKPIGYVNDEGQNTFNIDFNLTRTLPDESMVSLEIIASSMGEYDQPTGIEIAGPLCEMIDEPIIIGSILNTFGMGNDNCPPKPGRYRLVDYRLSEELFPDDFIQNKYKGVLKIETGSTTIAELDIYFETQ